MKIAKKQKKALLLVVPLAFLTIAVCWYGYTVYQQKKAPKENDINYRPATTEQKDAGVKAKEEFLNREEITTDNTNDLITITSANNKNDTLSVRTIINRIDNDGTCVFTLSKEGQNTVKKEAATQAVGSYSVCEGFDIPSNDLMMGDWNAEVQYYSSDKVFTGQANMEVKI